jgi:hypothetical protein
MSSSIQNNPNLPLSPEEILSAQPHLLSPDSIEQYLSNLPSCLTSAPSSSSGVTLRNSTNPLKEAKLVKCLIELRLEDLFCIVFTGKPGQYIYTRDECPWQSVISTREEKQNEWLTEWNKRQIPTNGGANCIFNQALSKQLSQSLVSEMRNSLPSPFTKLQLQEFFKESILGKCVYNFFDKEQLRNYSDSQKRKAKQLFWSRLMIWSRFLTSSVVQMCEVPYFGPSQLGVFARQSVLPPREIIPDLRGYRIKIPARIAFILDYCNRSHYVARTQLHEWNQLTKRNIEKNCHATTGWNELNKIITSEIVWNDTEEEKREKLIIQTIKQTKTKKVQQLNNKLPSANQLTSSRLTFDSVISALKEEALWDDAAKAVDQFEVTFITGGPIGLINSACQSHSNLYSAIFTTVDEQKKRCEIHDHYEGTQVAWHSPCMIKRGEQLLIHYGAGSLIPCAMCKLFKLSAKEINHRNWSTIEERKRKELAPNSQTNTKKVKKNNH